MSSEFAKHALDKHHDTIGRYTCVSVYIYRVSVKMMYSFHALRVIIVVRVLVSTLIQTGTSNVPMNQMKCMSMGSGCGVVITHFTDFPRLIV